MIQARGLVACLSCALNLT